MNRLALAVLAFFATANTLAGSRVVETIRFDLDGDGKPDKLVLSDVDDGAADKKGDKEGDFTRIDFHLGNAKHFRFSNPDRWIRFDRDPETRARITGSAASLIQSARLLLVDTVEGDRLLIAIGYGYASDPSLLSAYRISKTGIVQVMDKNLDLVKVADIDHDGRTDIVGSQISEGIGENCSSYDPDLVYTLRDLFKVNSSLTERYDRKTDGFYSADYSKFFVLRRKDGKRVLLPNDQQDRCKAQP